MPTAIRKGIETLGQELLDLDKAHQQGLISDDEFKKLKKEIMEKYKD